MNSENNDLNVREIYQDLLSDDEFQKAVTNVEHKFVIHTYGEIVSCVFDNNSNMIFSKKY